MRQSPAATAASTTSPIVIIVIVVVLLLVGVVVAMYNGLIKLRNLVQEAWRQIDVELALLGQEGEPPAIGADHGPGGGGAPVGRGTTLLQEVARALGALPGGAIGGWPLGHRPADPARQTRRHGEDRQDRAH